MSHSRLARDLLKQGRYTDALRVATEVGSSDCGYASARLVALRVLMEQARFAELTGLLDDTPAEVFTRDEDGRVLAAWRCYAQALIMPAGRGDVLEQVSAELAIAGDAGSSTRLGVEASALRARLTRLRVLYAESPHTASRAAADGFARAADGYRQLGLLPDAWEATLLRCRALRALPDEPPEPVSALLDEFDQKYNGPFS